MNKTITKNSPFPILTHFLTQTHTRKKKKKKMPMSIRQESNSSQQIRNPSCYRCATDRFKNRVHEFFILQFKKKNEIKII